MLAIGNGREYIQEDKIIKGFKRFLALALALLSTILLCSAVPAFAACGFGKKSPLLVGNGDTYISGYVTTMGSGSMHVGGMARFKVTAPVASRKITVTMKIYKSVGDILLKQVTQTGNVSATGAMTTDYFTFVSPTTFSYTNNVKCQYKVFRNNFVSALGGWYWGYVCTKTSATYTEVLNATT